MSKHEIECRFCHLTCDLSDEFDQPCLSEAAAFGCCNFKNPTPVAKPVTAEPMTPMQLDAMQQLIDDGTISALDYHSGDTSWARLARLLIDGGKLRPPRSKRGKADYARWGNG